MLINKKEELDSELAKQTLNYIISFGKILSNPCQAIVLQGFSEIIGFAPPILDNFAKKIFKLLFISNSMNF